MRCSRRSSRRKALDPFYVVDKYGYHGRDGDEQRDVENDKTTKKVCDIPVERYPSANATTPSRIREYLRRRTIQAKKEPLRFDLVC